jgi:hypothetical protein
MDDEDIVRVIRVLEFVGPRSWIERTMQGRWLRPDPLTNLDPEKRAKELIYIEEVIRGAQPELQPSVQESIETSGEP